MPEMLSHDLHSFQTRMKQEVLILLLTLFVEQEMIFAGNRRHHSLVVCFVGLSGLVFEPLQDLVVE